MRGEASKWLRRVCLAVVAWLSCVAAAQALTIELKDVASDRVERQRAAAVGALPLPGTPDLASFDRRLAARGVKPGDQVFIRIFKAESELEVWMRAGNTFRLLDVYPVCHWSGTIGPKIHEGDKQTPEGFYEVTRKQLHLIGRHPRSLNLGFPNAFDRLNQRTGSYILVHGGCSSVGCFAMTNSVVAEIYDLVERALKSGQDYVPVHVFPFRMTDANMRQYAASEWAPFWRNLKEGYDAFQQTRVPPRIGVCEKRYYVQSTAPEEVAPPGPLAVCGESLAALSAWDQSSRLVQNQLARWSHLPSPSASSRISQARRYPSPRLSQAMASLPHPTLPPTSPSRSLAPGPQHALVASGAPMPMPMPMPTSRQPGPPDPEAVALAEMRCDLRTTSCRRWLDLRKKAVAKALAFNDGRLPPAKAKRTATRSR